MKTGFAFIALLVLGMWGATAHAANIEPTANVKDLPPSLALNTQSELAMKPTSSQDVAFLFYKLAKLNPDFQTKITATPSFKDANQQQQLDILRKDVPILQMGYRNFVADAHKIIVRTNVKSKAMIGQRNGIELSFGGDPKGPIYFPYQWGGDRFAVLADGIDEFKFLPMKLETASRATGKINADGTTTLLLELNPIKADGRNPYPLDGVPQWLLMTKISRAWLLNEYREVLWDYTAPQ